MKTIFIPTFVCLMTFGFLSMNQSCAQDPPAPTAPPSTVGPTAVKRWQDEALSDRQEIDTMVKLELNGPALDLPPCVASTA